MELAVATRTVRDEDGKSHRFSYALLIDLVESGNFFCESYGVRVWEEDGGDVSVPNITTSAVRIDELISLLAERRVGPAVVRDVLEDWL